MDEAEFLVFTGHATDHLQTLTSECIDTVVTSPPYWNKRNYGHERQIGLESSPAQFVDALATVFDEVRRVLKPCGTLWLNIDDTYHRKELAGIPWLLAFEMKRRGWRLRQAVVWNKPNSTPEPVKTRCTHSYEFIFMFVLGDDYYYDAEAIFDPHTNPWALDCLTKFAENPDTPKINVFNKQERYAKAQKGITRAQYGALMNPKGKNKRDVWTISTEKRRGLRHYAPFPEQLITPCILAGCPINGIVLDPFCGSGTTGVVALMNSRNFVGIELVPESAVLAEQRLFEAYSARQSS